MSKYYDMIAKINIEINSPIVDDNSFDNLLIVGPMPAVVGDTAPPSFGAYSSMDEVEAAGWKVAADYSDPIASAAQVAFSQSPTPATIYIAPIKEGETALDTVKAACTRSGWYVLCTAGVESSDFENIAAFIETQEKCFCYTELNVPNEDEKNKVSPSVGSVYFRTLGIFGKESGDQVEVDMPEANKYINVAFAAKWLNYKAGSETTAFKSLAGVYPADLSTTEAKALENACITYFVPVGSKNITLGGKTMAGEWADIIRFRDWLHNDMQLRVVNLFVTSPKVPFTDSGIGLVQNQMLAALKAGQDAGGVAEDEFDEDGNLIPGYSTSVPRSSAISDSDKASRKLSGLKFKARLAGAIHFADIEGSLSYKI